MWTAPYLQELGSVRMNLGSPTSDGIIRKSGDYWIARLKRAMTTENGTSN